jgi:hypothetical protein
LPSNRFLKAMKDPGTEPGDTLRADYNADRMRARVASYLQDPSGRRQFITAHQGRIERGQPTAAENDSIYKELRPELTHRAWRDQQGGRKRPSSPTRGPQP